MDGTGLEHPALTASRTTISEESRAKCGAHHPPKLPEDPDLVKVIETWPGLPEHVKKAIMALIESHIEGISGDEH